MDGNPDYIGISVFFLCYDKYGKKFLLGKKSKGADAEIEKWRMGTSEFRIHETSI